MFLNVQQVGQNWIEDHIHLIDANDFINLYDECPISLRSSLTHILHSADTYPEDYMVYIPAGFLQGHPTLQDYNVFEGCLGIGSYAFQNCIALKKVTIPHHMRLNTHCFSNCLDLQRIDFGGTVEEWKLMTDFPNTFFHKCSEITVYCKDGVTTT